MRARAWCGIVTVAPELAGVGAYIAHAVRRGVTISLGHAAPDASDVRDAVVTDPMSDDLQAAFDAIHGTH